MTAIPMSETPPTMLCTPTSWSSKIGTITRETRRYKTVRCTVSRPGFENYPCQLSIGTLVRARGGWWVGVCVCIFLSGRNIGVIVAYHSSGMWIHDKFVQLFIELRNVHPRIRVVVCEFFHAEQPNCHDSSVGLWWCWSSSLMSECTRSRDQELELV